MFELFDVTENKYLFVSSIREADNVAAYLLIVIS